MALNLTTADAALKEDYLPVIREQLNNSSVILSQLERNTKDVEGRRAVLSLHVSRNTGVGSRPEGGTLPTAGQQGYREERVPIKYHYGRIQVFGPVIRAMKSDKGSFTRAIDSETKGLMTDMKRDMNRQSYNPLNGEIAVTGVTSAATTVVMDAATTTTELRQLEVGMLVDIGTAAAPTASASAVQVASVDLAASTVELTTAVTTLAGDLITRSGAGVATAGSTSELTGIRAIIATSGTLFNVDPTVETSWVSYEDDNSGTLRAATDNILEKAINEISIIGGVDPNFILTSFGVQRNYAAGLKTEKRYNDSTDLKGGFTALSVSAGNVTLPLMVDRDNPENTAFLGNFGHLCLHEESDWEWMDEDGAVLNRVGNLDAYEATAFCYRELTTDKRNAFGRINDLTES